MRAPLEQSITTLNGTLFRYAEDQERSVTRDLVPSIDEHEILERLLDDSKPQTPDDAADKHYLLSTAFRYPPLPFGSRFGTPHERGILYASESYRALQMELAFYRFSFYHDIDEPPATIRSNHVLFEFDYSTNRAIDLTGLKGELNESLTSPSDYTWTQRVGRWCRSQDIRALRYPCARGRPSDINVAVLDPAAIAKPPTILLGFTVRTTADLVTIVSGANTREPFDRDISIELFFVDGELPRPAN
ncbi:RES family NAD+ phosphorylase [Litorivicinus lipolyticus]|uniref:RES family NAD+ phosphorylase n=1 Tax=Litorivicinus lipolyticus TaxID=418701 RepID=UPI003B5CFE46